MQLAIEAVLVSPNFLFRIERDPETAVGQGFPEGASETRSPTPYRLSDHELASRLSYFLWSSMPDDELFRVAGQKRLHEPAVLNAQVTRHAAGLESRRRSSRTSASNG